VGPIPDIWRGTGKGKLLFPSVIPDVDTGIQPARVCALKEQFLKQSLVRRGHGAAGCRIKSGMTECVGGDGGVADREGQSRS
jgi:hypothetical protein